MSHGPTTIRDPFLKELHSFIKDYCVFFVGHWHCKQTPQGFEPTPQIYQLLQMFKERQVTAYIIDEYCTSKVIIDRKYKILIIS